MPHTHKPRILVVEDEVSLGRYLQLELEYEGYAVGVAQNGYEALGRLGEGEWDLILLDVMLPGLDGYQVCQRIRESMDIPIIMLTARDAVPDKVRGLLGGADDYVTKPFEIEELLARIQARLRRLSSKGNDGKKIAVGDLVVYLETRQVVRKDESIVLTKKEFDLLVCLAENAGTVLSRETILNRVWGYDYYGGTNIVGVYIRYLRSKIDEPFTTPLIQTVWGVGIH